MDRLNTIRSSPDSVNALKPSRLVIYAKDVQRITGKSLRVAQIFLSRIRRALKKTEDQFVTFTEFCEYTGMKKEEVYQFLFTRSNK